MHIRQSQFVILPPSWLAFKRKFFTNIETDGSQYAELLAEMQRLRGRVYLSDGAIGPSQLKADGRHALAVDERSWHILTLDTSGKVSGCLRFLEEKKTTRFENLWISQAALARCPVWGARFRRAVEFQLDQSRKKDVCFGEVGGWAVTEERRCTTDPLVMVLAACALFRLLGGCIGLATATVRHGSATILRRIGLAPLTISGCDVPSYFDPTYGCQMEALRYDSDFPNPKYAGAIDQLCAELSASPVVCRGTKLVVWPDLFWTPDMVRPEFPDIPAFQPMAV
jgi:hypothetical protein